MRNTSIVGARELKTRLGMYLNRVRKGETLLVTDRHEPVAELRPLTGGADPVVASLYKLATDGAVQLPTRRAAARFTPIRARGMSAGAAVASDRDERG
jgi:prevent-host-death family protein